MSATDSKYSLTVGMKDAYSAQAKGAAAASDTLTDALKRQEKEARNLKKTQKDLGNYDRMKAGLASVRDELAATQNRMRQLTEEKKVARQEATATRKAWRGEQKALDDLAGQMAAAAKPSAALAAAFDKQQAVVQGLATKVDAAENRVNRLGKSAGVAGRKAAALTEDIASQRRALGSLGDKLGQAGVSTRDLAGEQARLEKKVEGANAALDQQKKRLAAVGKAKARVSAADARMGELQGQMVGTAAMAATVALPVVRSVQMEAAMADVSKVVDFEGGEKQAFKSDLMKLSSSVNMKSDELTQIAAAAGQSGVAKADLFSFTESAAKMGVAFDMAAADAGETMAAWRAGMGLNQQQAIELADAVNHVSNNMNAKAKDISGVLKRQGSVATASGMSETQAASLAGALLSGGASEEVAATTMKNMLGALTRGEAATASQKNALSSLGLDAGSLASGMQSDALGTIQKVFDAMADAPVEEQSALISQLFGEESKGGVMPLLKNQALLQKAFGLTADRTAYLNSAQEEFASRAGTSEHRIGAAVKSFDRLAVVLGDSLLPFIGPVADGAAWLANGAADLAEQFPLAAGAITTVVAGTVALKAGMLAWRMAQAKVEQVRSRGALRQARQAGETSVKANLAAAAVDRFNRAMSRTAARGYGAGYGGGYGGGYGADGKSADGKKPGQSRRPGKAGRLTRLLSGGYDAAKGFFSRNAGTAAKVGVGAGAVMLPGLASADTLGLASDAVGALGDMSGASAVGKVVRPVGMMLQAGNLYSAVQGGKGADVGAAAGDIAGGLAGMWAGAAGGAALGSVVPVVGTAIGGLLGAAIGGLAGGEGGSWLGEKIGGLFDSDEGGSALAEAKAEAKVEREKSIQDNRQMSVSAPITVQAAPGQNADEIAEEVMRKLNDHMAWVMAPGTPLQDRIDNSMEVAG